MSIKVVFGTGDQRREAEVTDENRDQIVRFLQSRLVWANPPYDPKHPYKGILA